MKPIDNLVWLGEWEVYRLSKNVIPNAGGEFYKDDCIISSLSLYYLNLDIEFSCFMDFIVYVYLFITSYFLLISSSQLTS